MAAVDSFTVHGSFWFVFDEFLDAKCHDAAGWHGECGYDLGVSDSSDWLEKVVE